MLYFLLKRFATRGKKTELTVFCLETDDCDAGKVLVDPLRIFLDLFFDLELDADHIAELSLELPRKVFRLRGEFFRGAELLGGVLVQLKNLSLDVRHHCLELVLFLLQLKEVGHVVDEVNLAHAGESCS
jgi:hypothetical protein